MYTKRRIADQHLMKIMKQNYIKTTGSELN